LRLGAAATAAVARRFLLRFATRKLALGVRLLAFAERFFFAAMVLTHYSQSRSMTTRRGASLDDAHRACGPFSVSSVTQNLIHLMLRGG
jgi:hypothetical protein